MSNPGENSEAVVVTPDVAHDIAEADTAPMVKETGPVAEIARFTDRLKRALADAENTRKRADVACAEGQDRGVAMAVAALSPAFDALSLGIEAARTGPEAEDPRIAQHLEGLRNIRTVFEAALNGLGVEVIAPQNGPFDPGRHEAISSQPSDEAPGQVLHLHRPGLALGDRLIRPAHVTVSARRHEDEEA